MTRKCPGCGTEGALDDVLAPNQMFCDTPEDECRVVSYYKERSDD